MVQGKVAVLFRGKLFSLEAALLQGYFFNQRHPGGTARSVWFLPLRRDLRLRKGLRIEIASGNSFDKHRAPLGRNSLNRHFLFYRIKRYAAY
ncbi:MAG: hypothetical protein BWY71_01976 [Planctomycetes bacterium ADurb.Bin412]|nr:MAG: hypothetical protein BWY71_01976 [Planctomycetes bacterium ADurb.Bin412]